VRLILVRHAEAAPGEPDDLRPLTPAGRERARELAEELASARPATVLSSPLLRARETAEAIGAAAGLEPKIDERLAPGATVDDLRDAVDGHADPVVVVGHQPDCSELVLALTGREVRFPAGSSAEIEL
jgi:phosphohistidine phosphatase